MAERISSSAQPSNKGTKIIRKVIMGVTGLVVLGHVLIWIMIPTTTYRKQWRPKISAIVDSTYFGSLQGSRILINTVPMLFVAVLGSVYLHLGKKVGDNNTERRKKLVAPGRRPLIIKGLGIVSWIELAFLAMLIALLVWTFSTYLHFFFSKINQTAKARGDQVGEAKLERAAVALGNAGNIILALLFFPVTRGSSVLPLFGLTSERSIKYHIWLGHLAMLIFTTHGLLFISYWSVTHRFSQMVKWNTIGVSNVAGEISLVCGLLLWVTTYPPIRRRMFEVFFYTHHLYILFIIFFFFHLGISYAYIMLPGFYLFLLDRYMRFLQSRQSVRLISARILPCKTVELNFSKNPGLSYTPTSTMFINVPSISKLQWHPFTINSSSNLEPEILSVMIKSKGSWTNKLYHVLASSPSIDHLEVSVEGPYGPTSTHFLRHETLVMVSGGSGISPFISIIRDLIFANSTLKQKTPKILLVSAFKNSLDLTMLDLLLPYSYSPNSQSLNLDLQIEAYVTREKNPNPSRLRTIWFNLSPTDKPISPTLGQNNWLWLGAIVTFSCLIFLLLLGIITRFYIYPIDHNSNKIFSYSLRALLNLLIICISIVMTASAAFIWNKKQNAMKMGEGLEQGSLSGTDERELESFPQQSLAQSIKVHYGERPDLKRIVSECRGSSIGVLVCGPKKMKHDVARICSSGVTENLHFESISFSW